MHRETLNRVHETKCLGYFLCQDLSDDLSISKQMRTLYIRSNKLLVIIGYCPIDVEKNILINYIDINEMSNIIN